MEEMLLLDAVERYLRGEMPEEEKVLFETLRENTPEVDQLVVEHQLFLREMDSYADQQMFRSSLHAVHQQLTENGEFADLSTRPEAPVVPFWTRYKRTVAVAASIAGITALVTSGIFSALSPSSKPSEIQLLSLARELKETKQQVNQIDHALKHNDSRNLPASKRDGTGFLIDGKGYLVTNVHVVSKSDSVYVENNKGEFFKAAVVHVNDKTDVAILKIDDRKFTPVKSLPYSISKGTANLGEEVFTLGFPRSEIVYGKGYLSAQTGYNGDTVSYQVAISANPGNSGAPLFNNDGEVIGVVSGKQTSAENVVFAVRAKSIFNALEALKKDSNYARIKVSSSSNVRYMNRVQQIKKMQDCVFIVKSY